MVDPRRIREIGCGVLRKGPAIYIMSRDQRVEDNWALLYAQQLAIERKEPLIVACPVAAERV